MNLKHTFSRRAIRAATAIICALSILPGDLFAYALPASASPQTDRYAMLSADRLDSLVAPIALYPDPLLAQLLAASTYPSELQELDEWLEQNFDLTGHVLAEAVEEQPWDPSVQAMAVFPDVVKQLTENIDWTTDLGHAVLDQESDVMDAVQRMRQRAQNAGYLSSTAQQVIGRKVVDNRTVITIEPPSPDIVYVPVYNPAMIWGAPVYPWPRFYYAPRRGVWTGAALGFGAGIAVGGFWGRGGWGWRPGWGWGRNNIILNRNAVFIRNNRFYRGRTINTWRHNPGRGRAVSRRGPRRGAVATTGRGNVNRRNINRANVNRRNVNRGNVNRGNANRRNINRANNVNRRNMNRPAGTSGRNRAQRGRVRAGTANRGNRPTGTSGSFNRANRGGNRNAGAGGGRRGGGGARGGGGGSRGGGGRRR